jgi:hypothetical protein
MKVNDLLYQLLGYTPGNPTGNNHGDAEVVVLVSRASPAIGAAHTVSVKSVSAGFDWDNGKVLIGTSEPVYAGLDELERAAHFARKVREIMWERRKGMLGSHGNASCIKMIEEELDEWIPDRSEKLPEEEEDE